MFRRIEVITSANKKRGLNFIPDVLEGLQAPDLDNLAHCKRISFYFTEEGWRQVGRPALQGLKGKKLFASSSEEVVDIKVRTVKEGAYDVFYRDKLQVALRPRRCISPKRKEKCDAVE